MFDDDDIGDYDVDEDQYMQAYNNQEDSEQEQMTNDLIFWHLFNLTDDSDDHHCKHHK